MSSRQIILCLMSCLIGFVGIPCSKADQVSHIYAGGVAGVKDLLNPENSTRFRKATGGLYIHNNGWTHLNPDERRVVLKIFQNSPIGIELGYGSPQAWAKLLSEQYLLYNIQPVFIAANAFSHNNHPELAGWKAYSNALRAKGLPKQTKIIPTFEYQNFSPNQTMLVDNRVSIRHDFQQLIEEAGGLALDIPPGYAMHREQAYRDWVVDAIQWTREKNFDSVLIISPHNSRESWAKDTLDFVKYLSLQKALPSIFVCENYAEPTPDNYPNVVGDERNPNTALGNCMSLRQSL